MASTKTRQILFFQFLATLILCASSCNSKESDDESEMAVTPALVAVKNFYINANNKVLSNLDSVFFSIDLNTGVIFNADSLPLGTDVTKLVPTITFANSMTKADITFQRENKADTTVNYLTNPEDSIDFSYPVMLEVTAANGVNSFSYTIKVNVHKQQPDSLVWARLQTSNLPSRYPDPVAQKTVMKDGIAYCLVMESNDEFTISTSSDLDRGEWNSVAFNPGFAPDPESFTATPDGFYTLSMLGDLFASDDLVSWNATDENWATILGAYGNSVLGIKRIDTQLYHTRYPAPEGFIESPIEEGFPVYHMSQLGLIETKWADLPFAIMAGGITSDIQPTSNVWAYDGYNWSIINQHVLPPLEAPMLNRYVVFRDTPAAFKQREFDVWLLFGGMTEDGDMNKNVFISYDNGVTWGRAPEAMQLSDKIPALLGADVVVAYSDLSADLSEAWTLSQTKTRVSYSIDGFDITWKCPYLYVFGGYFPYPDNSLNTSIYRGVIQKLEFTPDI